ncbi:hypothetical protein LN565_07095 [Xanthomonas euvesicatoria pv. euvesicatoria]|uniref:Tripartite tricarboxylate transporter TctB family protein n=1 Tax=Xanthomonas euvesicatoria pv. euvesicatoria TaxID=2753541 RepID=A0ABS8LGK7_XANEU|nr:MULTISPECIES: hypothetical protein [Xanthomonas]MCC8501606.1 hypothetical protein [Xanthomonas euvesicatoria pv. euvesicatoria]MCC8515700.1 hypothetical protein [Xanthomonas euvesicatoria pv. euvesicatoria]MCC8541119.1 hypothetical protein [Xanthomonas euvesicatoria pv. euvesicatoria]MCC8545064.1 hypothetical protein [Xanthomonas euvesicatoria pv. euvesicatoria]MCC8568791.1 hypothetical protein [Xanthomonas euvesicatoria pv. euvesicatoria]
MIKNWPKILLAGAAVVLLSRALLSKENSRGATRSNISVQVKEPVPEATPVVPAQERSVIGRMLAAINREEARLDRVLDRIPAWLSATAAFGTIMFAAVVAFIVKNLPVTGPFSPMNLVFLSVIFFFAAVGVVPKTNARFWSLLGALVGFVMWIISLIQ